jgi:hypothetical protein
VLALPLQCVRLCKLSRAVPGDFGSRLMGTIDCALWTIMETTADTGSSEADSSHKRERKNTALG